MKESDFVRDLLGGLKQHAEFAHKISDLGYAATKPCDVVASIGGRCRLIEAKLTKFERAPPSMAIRPSDRLITGRQMRPHQVENLKRMAHGGGEAYVCVCLVNALQPRGRRAWSFPIFQFLHREEWRVGDVEQEGVEELRWLPGIGWGISGYGPLESNRAREGAAKGLP